MSKSAVVLDLDETLIKSYEPTNKVLDSLKNLNLTYRQIEVLCLSSRSLRYENYMTVQRPYLKEFLLFCREHFDYVCVWTAGTNCYAASIVNTFFVYDPDIVWSRSETNLDGNNRYKDLSKIKNELQNKCGEDVKVMMVDDLLCNCLNADNYHIIPKFEPIVDHNDTELVKLMDIIRAGVIKSDTQQLAPV